MPLANRPPASPKPDRAGGPPPEPENAREESGAPGSQGAGQRAPWREPGSQGAPRLVPSRFSIPAGWSTASKAAAGVDRGIGHNHIPEGPRPPRPMFKMVEVYERDAIFDTSSTRQSWQTIVDEMVDEFVIQAQVVSRVARKLVRERDSRYFMMLRKAAVSLKAGGISGRAFVRFVCQDHQRRSSGSFPFIEQVFGPKAVASYMPSYLKNAPTVRVTPVLRLPKGATDVIRAWESECKRLRRIEIEEYEKLNGVAPDKVRKLEQLAKDREARHAAG